MSNEAYGPAWKKAVIHFIPSVEELHSDGDPIVKKYIDSLKDIASWTQAILTALNVGSIQSESKLHLKLRDIMIAHRALLAGEGSNDVQPRT